MTILQDGKALDQVSFLPLRQSYASAITRLVNGLVDPLQFGVYARSIASIASQLGLPLWLVELRHAATHEDLPSLELLREGARQVIVYRLDQFYCNRLVIVYVLASAQLLDSNYQSIHTSAVAI